jgi:hypothetical protein
MKDHFLVTRHLLQRGGRDGGGRKEKRKDAYAKLCPPVGPILAAED